MASVRRVARLEGVDWVRLFLEEGVTQLVDGETVVVEAITIGYAAEEFNLAANGIVFAGGEQLLDVWVLVVNDAPSA